MRNLHNIEKSGFHRGQYVGYGAGKVRRIRKNDGGWRAICLAPGDAKHLTTLSAPSLVEMSMKLEAVEA